MKTSTQLFAVFCVIRFVFTYLQRSSMHPDEYWQGPEVAYRMVFDSKWRTWEWFPSVALRSHLHPMPFAIFYWIVSFLKLDSTLVISHGPRYLQSALVAVSDVAFYYISKQLFGKKNSAISTALYLTSWFSVFTLCRTTSNAAEAAL